MKDAVNRIASEYIQRLTGLWHHGSRSGRLAQFADIKVVRESDDCVIFTFICDGRKIRVQVEDTGAE